MSGVMWLPVAFSVLASVPPHVVLLYADDLGYNDLGVIGGSVGESSSPAIDELARVGVGRVPENLLVDTDGLLRPPFRSETTQQPITSAVACGPRFLLTRP